MVEGTRAALATEKVTSSRCQRECRTGARAMRILRRDLQEYRAMPSKSVLVRSVLDVNLGDPWM